MRRSLMCACFLFVAIAALVAADPALEPFIPKEGPSVVVRHDGYILGFNAARHAPDWLVYRFAPSMRIQSATRDGMSFKVDPLALGSVRPSEYAASGYDMGHLKPAEDAQYSADAMRETFYTSNIVPQLPALNRGDWKELENRVRLWVDARRELIIICGPIYALRGPPPETIGPSGVAVPESCFKIVLEPSTRAILGFVFPNTRDSPKDRPLSEYVRPVPEIETASGYHFSLQNFKSKPELFK